MLRQFEHDFFALLTGGLGAIILLDVLTHGSAAVQLINAVSNFVTGFYKALRG